MKKIERLSDRYKKEGQWNETWLGREKMFVDKINEIVDYLNLPRCVDCSNIIDDGHKGLFGGEPTSCISCENKAREEGENAD